MLNVTCPHITVTTDEMYYPLPVTLWDQYNNESNTPHTNVNKVYFTRPNYE